ncbi:MAG: hypothetical protein FWC41_00220 [Firmicutes bacterium]|nr:hypothetical protein [Bacillota bacterium]
MTFGKILPKFLENIHTHIRRKSWDKDRVLYQDEYDGIREGYREEMKDYISLRLWEPRIEDLKAADWEIEKYKNVKTRHRKSMMN